MKKNMFLVFCVILTLVLKGQNAMLTWAKRIGNTSQDEGHAITVDASGNVYTAGYFQGTADFDPGPGTYTLSSSGGLDVFISKLDVAGNFVWAKQMGGSTFDVAYGIVVDASGNVYTTGYFDGTSDFDPGIGTYTLSAFAGSNDIFISKLDAAGNFVWAKQMGGTLGDTGQGIALDGSGNVYTTGLFNGIADLDPGVGTFTLAAFSANTDVFVSKLDAAGNFVWAKQLGGNANDAAYSIFVDGSGNVHTSGIFSNTGDFDPGVGTYTLASVGPGDIFISKLDVNGNFVWAKQMGGSTLEGAEGIAVDGSGNVYTTGYFQGTADFDPSPGTYTFTSSGSNDVFVSKLDVSGNFVWAKQLVGGIYSDIGCGIALDGLGDVYTTGSFVGTVDFDPGAATFTMSSIGTSGDVFIFKLNTAGNFDWAKRLGGSLNEVGLAIAVSSSGSVHTTGSFENTVDFDPNAGFFGLTSAGNGDIFIHKMGQCAIVTTTLTALSNVLCYGGATGAATISASGGSGFTYTWSPSGGNSASASGFFATTYSCTVTNSCGSTATQTVAIFQPFPVTLTAVANNSVVCAGDPSTLTASGGGGVPGYSYSWTAGPSSTMNVVNPISTSLYSVTITDANNCSKSQTVSVITNSLPILSVNNGSICSGDSFTILSTGANTYTFEGGVSVVNPTASTSYTVVGTNTATGCKSQSFVTSLVTVNPHPTISVNSGSVCSGNSFTLQPSGANTYTFEGGSAVVGPSVTTSYTIVGSSLGCLSSNVATANVMVSASPTVNATSSTSLLCVGETATLTVSGADTYSWNTSESTTLIVVSPTITTTYSVAGMSSVNGCTSNFLITQTVSDCIGIESQVINHNRFSVFPNPFDDKIVVTTVDGKYISIFNALGELVYIVPNENKSAEINLQHLPSGIYVIRSDSMTRKIIKK